MKFLNKIDILSKTSLHFFMKKRWILTYCPFKKYEYIKLFSDVPNKYENYSKIIATRSYCCSPHDEFCNTNEITANTVCEIRAECSELLKKITTLRYDFDKEHLLYEECVAKLSNFSDHELLELLAHLHYLQENFRNSFKESQILKTLVQQIDVECDKRALEWDLETFLKFFKLYRTLLNAKCRSRLAITAIKRWLYKALKFLPLPLLIEFFECINTPNAWRKYHVDKYELVHYLNRNFANFNINEMGVYLYALLCLRTVLDDEKLKLKILDNLANNFQDATSKTLLTFLEFIEFQTWSKHNPFPLTPSFVPILKIMSEKFDNIDFSAHAVVSVSCTKFLIYDPEYFKKVSLKYLDEIRNLKVRQINNVLYSLIFFHFNLDSINIYEKFLDTLEKEPIYSIYEKHPKRLIQAVMYLSSIGIYRYNLLNKIFSNEYLRKTYCKKKLHSSALQKSIFILANAIKIECPDYKGNTLEEKLLLRNIEYNTKELPDCFKSSDYKFNDPENPLDIRSLHSKIICDIKYVLKIIFGGTEYTHVCYLLSQFPKGNILFSLDSNGKPVKLPESITRNNLVDSNSLDKNLNWYTVCIFNRNPLVKPDMSPPVISTEECKIRLLKLLGYKIIRIVANEWYNLSYEEKSDLLKNGFAK